MEPVQAIVLHTANVFARTTDEILGRSRLQPIVEARQAAMWAIRQRYPSIPLEMIGAALGGRHYTTVRHALAAVEDRASRDSVYRDRLQALLTRITPPTSAPARDANAPPGELWWRRVITSPALV
jgi:chromosomal replication initiation ATPase DnaA